MSSGAVSKLHTEVTHLFLMDYFLHIMGVGQLFLKRHNGSYFIHLFIRFFKYK